MILLFVHQTIFVEMCLALFEESHTYNPGEDWVVGLQLKVQLF